VITTDTIRAEVERNIDSYLETLFKLLRQRSISAQGDGVEECARLVAEVMADAGIESRVMATAGFPVVFGEVRRPDAAGTLLIYGHYDVQPPEPYEAWQTPPFEPSVRGGRVYARGAGDNKGQFLAHILAYKLLADLGEVPALNLKFLIEGEEESGSVNLGGFMREHRDTLVADAVYAADGPMHLSGRPVVFFGLRGMLNVEVRVRGANRDLHSGNFGGPVPNAIWRLVELLETMRDDDGRVLIDGFYDEVAAPTAFELDLLESIPFDEVAIKRDLDIDYFDGPPEASYYEKLMFYPTLNLQGITGGYTGPGKKSVIPSEAIARLECRLVPNQTPDEVFEKIERHIHYRIPDATVNAVEGTLPSKTSPELPVSRAVVASVGEAFGVEPVVYPLLGASGPNFLFTDELGLPAVWTTYANPDENNHAPNENLTIEAFKNGIVASARLLSDLGASGALRERGGRM
jgi:acetylornithine deacetylase/succinyl-diaminopimelate desuccinylase-like protein